jgi:hypothetical protein
VIQTCFEDYCPKDFEKLCKKDIIILESIIFEYLTPLKNSIERDRLISLAHKCGLVTYYINQLEKNNIIKQNIACMRLGALGVKDANTKLLSLLKNNTTTLFLNAANALIKINGTLYLTNVIKRLQDFKTHENYFLIEKRVMNIVAEINDDIFDSLYSLIQSNDVEQLIFSLKILAYRKDSRANSYILNLMKHDNEEVSLFAKKTAISLGFST